MHAPGKETRGENLPVSSSPRLFLVLRNSSRALRVFALRIRLPRLKVGPSVPMTNGAFIAVDLQADAGIPREATAGPAAGPADFARPAAVDCARGHDARCHS